MGNEIAELWTVLRFEGSPFIKGVLTAQAQAEESSSKIGKAWGKLAELGKASSVVMGVAAVGAVKLAMGFDQEMARVHTQAGASMAEVKQLSGQVLGLAGTVGIGPEKLAEGLYHVESAGFRGAVAMGILTSAAKLAAIGNSDLETTTQAVVGVMASEIKGVKDAADAGNLLNTTVGIGDMRMQQLAQAIGTGILPKAASVGLTFEDVGAALATLTDNVTPANEAATRLGMTFSMMAAPTDKAKTAYKEIGMSTVQLANDLRSKGIVGALQDLKSHLEATYPASKAVKLSLQDQKEQLQVYSQSLTAAGVPLAQQKTLLAQFSVELNKNGSAAVMQSRALSAMFGGGKSSGTMLTLLNELPRVEDKMKAFGTASSRAAQMQDAWKVQQAQFSQQLKNLGASAQVVGVKVGNFLIPPLQAVMGFFSKHTTTLKIFAGVLGGIMVAAMVAWTASVVANTVAMLADPMTWIILAIIAAIALLVVGIYELVKHWSTVWKWIKRIAADVWGWLLDAWHAVWDKGIKAAAMAVWDWLVSAWNATINAIAAVVGWVKSNIIDPIVNFFDKYFVAPIKFYLKVLETVWHALWTGVRAVLAFAWGFISTVFKSIRDKIVNFLMPYIIALKLTWKLMWDAITTAAKWAWNNILKPVIDALVSGWKIAWKAISDAAKWAWDHIIKPTMGFIDKYGIKPVKAGINDLKIAWDVAWNWIKKAVSTAWDTLKVIWGYIKRDGIDKIKAGIDILKNAWDTVWNDIQTAVEKVWGKISGIFDKITGAISKITGGIGSIFSNPGKAGSDFAKLLGFDQGGWVPGAAGAPMVAIVHGGELVLSRDMLAGRAATPIRVGAAPAAVRSSNGGGNTIIVQSPDIYLDGRKVNQTQQTRAQRVKNRNGTSFMA